MPEISTGHPQFFATTGAPMNDAYDTPNCPPEKLGNWRKDDPWAEYMASVGRSMKRQALDQVTEVVKDFEKTGAPISVLQTDTRTVRDILMARYEQAVVEMKRRQADIDLLPPSVLDMKADEARRLFGAIF